jgi:hypothetical protein
MTKSMKTLEFKFERTIPAPLGEVFDAWLNPKIPGNPWNAGINEDLSFYEGAGEGPNVAKVKEQSRRQQ